MKSVNVKVAVMVTSPLQILLAKKICDKEKITNSIYHIFVNKGDVRESNLIAIAKLWDLEYELHYFSDDEFTGLSKYVKLLSSLGNDKGYDKIIIGMFPDIPSHLLAIKYVKNKGEVLYIDDGTATFIIPDEKAYKEKMKSPIWSYIYSMLWLKRVTYNRYLTIFDNVKSKHYDFEVVNPFDTTNENNKENGIFVLGTNSDYYVKVFEPTPSIEDFNIFMKKYLSSLKVEYPGERIYYSPHGRDNTTEIIDFCMKNDITVIRSKYCVEVDYVINGYNPKVIVGPSSTALFTLKKIFPKSKVIDIVKSGYTFKNTETRLATENEMKSQGIELQQI